MTACLNWKDRLLDVALGVPASPELVEHVSRCAACSTELTALRAAREQMDVAVLSLVQGGEISPAFRARLWNSLESRRARVAGWPVRMGIAAAVAVVAVLGVFLASRSERWAHLTRPAPALSASAPALLHWRSPTQSLLRSSADPFLESSPRLGEFFFAINPARRAVDPEEERERKL